MSGGVKLEFPAATISEAVMTATTRWRVLTEDPEATLPWSTNIEFYQISLEGPDANTEPRMMALVRIEFDRKVVDEITGASSESNAA